MQPRLIMRGCLRGRCASTASKSLVCACPASIEVLPSSVCAEEGPSLESPAAMKIRHKVQA